MPSNQMGVKAVFALVYHPQSNRAVEKVNALIFSAIKKYWKTSRRTSGQRSYRGRYGAITPPPVE
jgi:hypothetical protein